MKRQLIVLILSLASFLLFTAPTKQVFYIFESKPMWELTIYESPPLIDQYEAWRHHLYFKESSCTWDTINRLGYIGGFQFGKSALKQMGYRHITTSRFKRNPNIFPLETQMKVFDTFVHYHTVQLAPYEEYIGKEIKGIPVTKAGLLAGAHLGGAKGVILFLTSNGRIDRSDGHTKISDYIREFSMYEF